MVADPHTMGQCILFYLLAAIVAEIDFSIMAPLICIKYITAGCTGPVRKQLLSSPIARSPAIYRDTLTCFITSQQRANRKTVYW